MYERQVHYTTLTQTLLHVAAATANSKNRVFCLLLQCMLRLLGEKRNSYCIKKKKKEKRKTNTCEVFSSLFFLSAQHMRVRSLAVRFADVYMHVCVCVCVRCSTQRPLSCFFFLFTYAFPLQWMPVVVVRGGCWITTFFPLRYRDQLQIA